MIDNLLENDNYAFREIANTENLDLVYTRMCSTKNITRVIDW